MSLLLAAGAAAPINYTLVCASGAYVYTGQAATLVVARNMALDAGAYAYAGQDAVLNVVRGASTTVSPGAGGPRTHKKYVWPVIYVRRRQELKKDLAAVQAKAAKVDEQIGRLKERLHKAEDTRSAVLVSPALIKRSEALQTRAAALTADIARLRFQLADLEDAKREFDEEEFILMVMTGTIQ